MSKHQIKQLIQKNLSFNEVNSDENYAHGLIETGIKGVQLFKVTHAMRCAPAVYEPCIVAIVSGAKEAILDGKHFIYDENSYMCCPMSMPVEAGTPTASPDNPLLGVIVSLDTKVMTELSITMAAEGVKKYASASKEQGLTLAAWDDSFTDSLLRLLQLVNNPVDIAILGEGRLRELYYAILNGQAGSSVRQAFGVGNDIARSIDYLASRLDETITIGDMAAKIGVSRAVLHRKFKDATSMSPIQFVKSMRLNTAAMKIATGINVSSAAMSVGYVSSSQFSREFKRMYGQSPKQWSQEKGHSKARVEQAINQTTNLRN
jgi:AraC-like DNA-binding protein